MENNTLTTKKPRRRFSKPLRILGVVFLVLVFIFSGLFYIARPYDKSDIVYKDIVISNGSNTDDVAATLVENGIIGSEGRFKFLSTVLLHNDKFKPGIYSLSPSMDMNEIADLLIHGITTENGFEIPAGYTLKQTATALESAGFVDADKFIELANSGIFNDQFDFLEGSTSLEGFLLPGTYELSKEADENMIITTMLYQFDNFYTDEIKSKAAELGLTTKQLIAIASIVEKDTNNDNDGEEIANVLIKRIKLGMGIDGGLPDKPLCSPSKESINAVAFAQDTEALYYVLSAKLNGTYVFTSSLDEYNKLKADYDAAHEKKLAEKKN